MSEDSAAAAPAKRPVHLWVALGAALITVASFAVPCTRLGDQSVTPWDLTVQSQRIIDEMEKERGKIDKLAPQPPPPPLPLPGDGPHPLRDKVDSKRAELKAKIDLTENILGYVHWGLVALLVVVGLQIVPLLAGNPTFSAIFGGFAGFAGFLFAGTLGVVAVYLKNLTLLGRPFPIEVGYWGVFAGTVVLALAGLLSLRPTKMRLLISLPCQLIPAAAWTLYFRQLLLG
ncbi:MAG: hypothetical protein AB7K24_20090 [Gemmataceae bacterium]